MDRRQLSNMPSLVCAFMASLTTGGTTYAFGLYGAALKKSLHLSQGELDTISTAFFCAGLFSWIPGLVADKFGSRFATALGGLAGAISLLSYWAVARQFIIVQRDLLVPVLSALSVIIFLSNACITGSVFKIIVANCGPGTKGAAVGVAKGYVGLGAGVYACLFQAIRRRDESDLDFLPMAAFFAIVCAFIPALMILPAKQYNMTVSSQDDATPLHFRMLYFSLVSLAILVVGSSMAQLLESHSEYRHEVRQSEHGQGGPHYGLALVLVTVWLGPISSLFYLPKREHSELELAAVFGEDVNVTDNDVEHSREKLEEDAGQKISLSSSSRQSSTPPEQPSGLVVSEEIYTNKDDKETVESKSTDSSHEEEVVTLLGQVDEDQRRTSEILQSQAQEDYTLYQMVRTPTAFFMLWTTTILVGAGTVETNNMGQMVESLGFAEGVTAASLALFSVAQAGSRVATGAVSEAALKWNVKGCAIDKGVPRTAFLIVASFLGFLAHSILAMATDEFIFVFGAALAGAAFGMVWPLLVLITGEIFGTANVSANYLFYDGVSSAAGTFFISKLLAQKVYEDHIDSNSPDPFTCLGVACFRDTHIVVALLTLTCIVTSVGTLYASRHVYNNDRHILHERRL